MLEYVEEINRVALNVLNGMGPTSTVHYGLWIGGTLNSHWFSSETEVPLSSSLYTVQYPEEKIRDSLNCFRKIN